MSRTRWIQKQLLLRYRSVRLCSRNDAIGNIAVLIAAGAVWLVGNAWPDLVVAAIIATLFLWSATSITRQAVDELRRGAVERKTLQEPLDHSGPRGTE